MIKLSDIHCELGEIIAGKKPGRTSEEEITIFDTGHCNCASGL